MIDFNELIKIKQRSSGEKKSPDHITFGTKDGQIEFGHLHLAGEGGLSSDVTSGVMLQAYDSLHYMSMDIDGPRAGWTLNRCPGPYEILCASKNAGIIGSDKGVGFFLDAENGDIVIRAPKGRIRLSALDIDIRAEGPDNTRGTINLDANQSINIKTEGSFNVKADIGVKIFSPKSIDIVANTTMSLVSNFITNLTSASASLSNKSGPKSQSTQKFNQSSSFNN